MRIIGRKVKILSCNMGGTRCWCIGRTATVIGINEVDNKPVLVVEIHDSRDEVTVSSGTYAPEGVKYINNRSVAV